MEELPIHLQSRIYQEAGVNGVCTTCRDAVHRSILLADQLTVDVVVADGGHSPEPPLTWRVAAVAVDAPDETEAHLGAVLQRLGQRFKQLKHISVRVDGPDTVCVEDPAARAEQQLADPSDSDSSGMRMFTQHFVPSLVGGQRLTLRGHVSLTSPTSVDATGALPWRLLVQTHLGAACTRLEVTSQEPALLYLTENLNTLFPVLQTACLRSCGCRPPVPLPLQPNMRLRAPNSLTHLTLVLWPSETKAPDMDGISLRRAMGLRELACRVLPDGALAHHGLLSFCRRDAPALCSVLGHSQVVMSRNRVIPGVRRMNVVLVRNHSELMGLAHIKRLLVHFKSTIELTGVELQVTEPAMSEAEGTQLLIWADGRLPYALTLAAK